MAASITVPVRVTPEAAARIAELGYQAEFERMLEKVQELVPGLRRIEAWLAEAYEPEDETKIDLVAFTMPPDPPDRQSIYDQFSKWIIATFPSDVWRYFLFSMLDEVAHAG